MTQARNGTGAAITELLRRIRQGDGAASEELIPLVYGELHRIARKHLRKERPGHTLQPTALVNEAYLRIFQAAQPLFADRAHFMALASRVMRRILVDYARRRAAAQRGGSETLVDISLADVPSDTGALALDLLDLDHAIEELAREHPQVAAAVEMRYFGGMTADETAAATGRSVHVVQHDLRFAHAWLRRRLADSPERTTAKQ
jgi:RNA polymerase sigma factor (TIGR02999 family)